MIYKRATYYTFLSIILATLSWWGWSFFHVDCYYTCLPVSFSDANIPCIDIKIEGISYPMKFDMGSKVEMTLHKTDLQKIKKYPYRTISYTNVRGTTYETPQYLVPKVQLGSLCLKQVKIAEEIVDHEATLWKDSSLKDKADTNKALGYVGRPLFDRLNVLFDFQKSSIILTNDLKRLKKEGYLLDQMVPVPIEMTPKGVMVNVETDLGTVKLAIDTGATACILKQSILKDKQPTTERYGLPVYHVSKFSMGGHDFGERDLYFFNITEKMTVCEGALGMDFLRHHVVYLDTAKQIAYIQK